MKIIWETLAAWPNLLTAHCLWLYWDDMCYQLLNIYYAAHIPQFVPSFVYLLSQNVTGSLSHAPTLLGYVKHVSSLHSVLNR